MGDHLTKDAQKRIEENFDNTREAFALLELIDAEFRTDPMSVQCFDLRVVERVRQCVQKRADFKQSSAFAAYDD